MMLGGVLIAPEFMTLVNAAADSGVTTTMVYGVLPAQLNNYSSTVLPMVLSMPVLMVVEKFMKKVVPDMLSTVFVPVGTMAVMIPVSLCALAPIGSILGSMVGNFMFGLGNAGGIVTILSLVVIAALWEFLVMTGMHQVLLALGIVQLLTLAPTPALWSRPVSLSSLRGAWPSVPSCALRRPTRRAPCSASRSPVSWAA